MVAEKKETKVKAAPAKKAAPKKETKAKAPAKKEEVVVEKGKATEQVKEVKAPVVPSKDVPKEAILEMMEISEVYVVKSKDGPILCVTGLAFDSTIELPQFFCVFTNEVKKNLRLLVIGSRMIIGFFDKTHPWLCMSILSDFPIMLNWAASLGFEAVGISERRDHKYVEFVRCNPIEKSVSHKLSRPVMH